MLPALTPVKTPVVGFTFAIRWFPILKLYCTMLSAGCVSTIPDCKISRLSFTPSRSTVLENITASGSRRTATLQVSLLPLDVVTVMVASPSAMAVTRPVALTLATFESLLSKR